jgi:monothiol glutaredoxin
MALDEATRSRIRRLVDTHPVLLFMKGTREEPRCGFSATVVQLLDQLVADYETCDVLADAAVREGIKEFSEWPTIPQLYVGGEFLGGCDIVTELFQSGELHARLGVEPGEVAPPAIEVRPEAAQALRSGLAEAPEGSVLRLLVDARYRSRMVISPPSDADFVVETQDLALHVDPLSASRAQGASIDLARSRGAVRLQVLLPHAPGA